MKFKKPIRPLEWAIRDVIGFVPNGRTQRKWVCEGINGVKLKTVAEGVYRSDTDSVVTFVFRANRTKPPAQAFDLDPSYLPRSVASLLSVSA